MVSVPLGDEVVLSLELSTKLGNEAQLERELPPCRRLVIKKTAVDYDSGEYDGEYNRQAL